MDTLNYEVLAKSGYNGYILKNAPEKVLQFGEGNFLRAFVDYWFDLANEKADWNGKCVLVQPIAPGLAKMINEQEGLYTLYLRGSENGRKVDDKRVISSVSRCLNPYEEEGFKQMMDVAASDDLEIIVSNTTEAGIVYDPACKLEDVPASSFPGKLTQVLYHRYKAGKKGIIMLACELIDNNGKELLKCVNQYIDQWGLDDGFRKYVNEDCTFCGSLVDRIVPAATPETLQEIADQLGVYDPCAIACEPFRQWVIEDNFVNGRPDWDKVGAQFVADVVPFEMMKLRMLNGSHSFLAYLGYLGGYETIADTMTNPAYRKAAFALMMQEQAPTLSMPEGTDLNAYATLLIERFSNPSLRHRTWQIAMDGSQKLPQRLLDPVRLHLQNGGSWRHLALGVAGWMRYTQGVDEQGNAIDVVDPMMAEFQKINAQYQGADRVKALLGLSGIFADDLPQNADFVGAVTAAYQQLCERGARECVAAL